MNSKEKLKINCNKSGTVDDKHAGGAVTYSLLRDGVCDISCDGNCDDSIVFVHI